MGDSQHIQNIQINSYLCVKMKNVSFILGKKNISIFWPTQYYNNLTCEKKKKTHEEGTRNERVECQ